MKVTIFAQKKKTKEGREFYTYLASLNKKDGKEISVKPIIAPIIKQMKTKFALLPCTLPKDLNLTWYFSPAGKKICSLINVL